MTQPIDLDHVTVETERHISTAMNRGAAAMAASAATICSLLLIGGARADVNAGLVGWWKLDEGSGTVAQDSSANHNDGRLINMAATAWVQGSPAPGSSHALAFDGRDDYVEVPYSASLKLEREMTVALWIRFTGTGAFQNFVSQFNKISDECWSFETWETNQILVSINNYPEINLEFHEVTTNNVLTRNEWMHLAFTWKSNTRPLIYKNGVVLETFTQNGQDWGLLARPHQAAVPIRLGAFGGHDDHLDGQLDDVRLYNRVLLSSEISELYAPGGAKKDASAPDVAPPDSPVEKRDALATSGPDSAGRQDTVAPEARTSAKDTDAHAASGDSAPDEPAATHSSKGGGCACTVSQGGSPSSVVILLVLRLRLPRSRRRR